MIGSSPIASRSITGMRAEFMPISVFLTDTLPLVDSIGEVGVEFTTADALVLVDALSQMNVEATLNERLQIKDYLVALVDGKLFDGWSRTGRPSTSWRTTDRP